MNWPIVSALVAKDVTLFLRNRFFALVSVLAIVAYAGVYFAMPGTVDETLAIGVYAPGGLPIFNFEGQGVTIGRVGSEESLREAVMEGDFEAGIVVPPGTMEQMAAGEKPRIDILFPSDAPQEFKDAIITFVQELAYRQSGQPLNVHVSTEVLGMDRLGRQIPPRDRMLPLFAVLVVLMETLGMASLISEEVEAGTAEALLVTPVTVRGLFLAKGVTGVTMAFAQAALLLAITGGLSQQPLIILLALFLGSLLVTGIGFLLASAGKDLMSVMAWGIPIMIILGIPAFGVMFPGTVTGWVKAVPSYYLVNTVHLAANFGLGWGEVWQDLPILLGFDAAFIVLGIVTLRRKFR